jgi:hypothetical protein
MKKVSVKWVILGVFLLVASSYAIGQLGGRIGGGATIRIPQEQQNAILIRVQTDQDKSEYMNIIGRATADCYVRDDIDCLAIIAGDSCAGPYVPTTTTMTMPEIPAPQPPPTIEPLPRTTLPIPDMSMPEQLGERNPFPTVTTTQPNSVSSSSVSSGSSDGSV